MRITASLRPRPSVRGEEPHPTGGDPVVQSTADNNNNIYLTAIGFSPGGSRF